MSTLANPLLSIYTNLPPALRAELYAGAGQGALHMPKRYLAEKPEETGAFILPLKQSFIKDARLMPGTRCMLALLAGWAGKGRAVELCQATIAKHIGRSVRQVYRYLKDASREGYLRYSYSKNRFGMITGIKIWLRFELLRHLSNPKPDQKPRTLARTLRSDTNQKHIYNREFDPVLSQKLERLRAFIEHP